MTRSRYGGTRVFFADGGAYSPLTIFAMVTSGDVPENGSAPVAS